MQIHSFCTLGYYGSVQVQVSVFFFKTCRDLEVDPADVGAHNARNERDAQDIEESDDSSEDGDAPDEDQQEDATPDGDAEADAAAPSTAPETLPTRRTALALGSQKLSAEGRARVERFLRSAVSGAEAVPIPLGEHTSDPESALSGVAAAAAESEHELESDADQDAGSRDGPDEDAASARSHSAGHPETRNDALKRRVRKELRAEQQHVRNRRIMHTARAQLQARARRERKQHSSDIF